MIRRLLRLFSLQTNRHSSEKPDIRYADPSHDHRNWKPQSHNAQPIKSTSVSSPFSWRSGTRRDADSNPKSIAQNFKNINLLKKLTLECLQEAGRDGESAFNINGYIAGKFSTPAMAGRVLSQKWVKDQLYEARERLMKEGLIGYNKQQEVFYLKARRTREPTDKEKKYHAVIGLGDGWDGIPNELEGIRWLHGTFTPDEFEHFAINILSTHCGVPVTITEKRPISGADGGFDGIGIYVLNGETINVAVQVKRLDLMSQVGEQHCRDFAGALMLAGWNHGFMITTGKFSDRAIQAIEIYKQRGYFIELIDQDRLAKIMLTKTTAPHGFGLHKTDYGFVYINEEILYKAAKATNF